MKSLQEFTAELVDKIYNSIPEILRRNLGITREKIEDDLSDQYKNGEITTKYEMIDTTIQSEWENDQSVEQAFDNLFNPYKVLLLGHASVM